MSSESGDEAEVEMSALDVAIRLNDVGKIYKIYEKPRDRLLQALWPGRKKFYREFQALSGIDLEILRGETIGVVGRNGSGKSTLLQLIAGVLQPSAGTVNVNGHVVPLLTIGAGFNVEFSGRENVLLNASILGLEPREAEEKLDEIIAFADIGPFFDQPVRSYSSGMYSRLAFAVAINADPDILIVDEVLAVGDEAFRRKCFSRIEDIKAKGATILLASHSATTVIELCDRAVLIDSGERLLLGSPKTVVSRYQRLLYAPEQEVASVLAEIREIDNAGEALTSTGANKGPVAEIGVSTEDFDDPEDFGSFDADFKPESTVEYIRNGAQISNVRILDPHDNQVNVLRPWQTYTYVYDVEFLASATSVRFGMMVKLTSGLEMGGQVSEPAGDGIEFVPEGARWEVRFQFQPALLPGTYFLNAGARGREDGVEGYLHRILDAAVFRIDPRKRERITGHVDFSAGTLPVARPLAESASDSRWLNR